MRLGNFISALVVVVVVSTLGFCQGERDPTVAESLQKHNIALTKTALVTALRNPDEEVRGLAALMLAQEKTTDAVPSIAQALANESAPKATLDIAMALAQFRDERGFAALRAVCRDPHALVSLRLVATINMLNVGDDSCSSAVVDILESKADRDYLTSALSLAPRFQHATRDESQKIFDLVVRALEDKESSVRFTASDALAKLGDPSALPYLETAAANEQEDTVRSQMQADLRRLRLKQKP
jgi:HEAT repeat protein